MLATNLRGSSRRQYPVSDHLFFNGPTCTPISETAGTVKEVVEMHRGKGWRMARDKEEGQEMWIDRKMAHYTEIAFGGVCAKCGVRMFGEYFLLLSCGRVVLVLILMWCLIWNSVPISKLPQLLQETYESIVKSGLKFTMVGHAGDDTYLLIFVLRGESTKGPTIFSCAHILGNFHTPIIQDRRGTQSRTRRSQPDGSPSDCFGWNM